ncbi:MAG: NAD(P)H-dependent glycerol-3-phosphate dehydrogenase [Methanobacteriota archaeon]
MHVGVVGGGSWGTTLALLSARNGHDTTLWIRDPAFADEVQGKRENAHYLPGVKLPDGLVATGNLRAATGHADLVIHAVPSHATREAARKYAPFVPPETPIVSATKGLEDGSHKRMSEVIADETGHPVLALSGPNHAEEVSRGLIAATTVAHPKRAFCEKVVDAVGTEAFRMYPRPDLVGVELCGAFKNVVAIAAGMSDGLGFGDNARAAVITLGLREMVDMVAGHGGQRETCYGLAGVGDLVVTCTSKWSRNRFFGQELAKARSADEIAKELHGQVVEGARSVRAFDTWAREERLELPLTHAVHRAVVEGNRVDSIVKELLSMV